MVEYSDPLSRATKLFKENRYFSLATTDESGAWCAPINYVIGPKNGLLFYSSPTSRHAKAIGESSYVAGAIFDSRATSSEVDGLQFRGLCSVVSAVDLASFHKHYFMKNFFSEAERQWWYRDVTAFAQGAMHRFYFVEMLEVFVIDFESLEKHRLDQRLPIDMTELWSKLI